ncbi:hypothetical protein B0T22DRAFT_270145 [Podospora appendiculata]|uniref:Uncharacterized protein n=1 Tax=Podospora appendiculata TaxID=314037 RepID=A0AAE0X3P2_9PEZI|nr:hypothetical protein B0T22DRAFT_270145 [Podospora appendiculata]
MACMMQATFFGRFLVGRGTPRRRCRERDRLGTLRSRDLSLTPGPASHQICWGTIVATGRLAGATPRCWMDSGRTDVAHASSLAWRGPLYPPLACSPVASHPPVAPFDHVGKEPGNQEIHGQDGVYDDAGSTGPWVRQPVLGGLIEIHDLETEPACDGMMTVAAYDTDRRACAKPSATQNQLEQTNTHRTRVPGCQLPIKSTCYFEPSGLHSP